MQNIHHRRYVTKKSNYSLVGCTCGSACRYLCTGLAAVASGHYPPAPEVAAGPRWSVTNIKWRQQRAHHAKYSRAADTVIIAEVRRVCVLTTTATGAIKL